MRRHTTAVLLAHSLFSFLGMHRFFYGKNGTALLRFVWTVLQGVLVGALFSPFAKGGGFFWLALGASITSLGNLVWYYLDLMRLFYAYETDADGFDLKGSETRNKAIFLWLLFSTGLLGLHQFYLRNTIRGVVEFSLFYAVFFLGVFLLLANQITLGWVVLLSILGFILLALLVFDLVQFLTRRLPLPGRLQWAEDKPRSRFNALLLNIWGGLLGLDRYYLGYKLFALVKFFTLGGFLLWNLLDFVLLYMSSLKDADRKNLV